MIRRLLAAAVVAVLAALSLVTPAYAATINGCDAARICFYDWINNNYASGFWQRPIYGANSVLTSNDGGIPGCMNLNDMYWHDLDGLVYDAASSMIINQYNTKNYRIEIYDWINCNYNAANMDYNVAPNELIIETNLHTLTDCDAGGCGISWYNKPSSIRAVFVG